VISPETAFAALGTGHLDWQWLASRPALSEAHHVRHLRLAEPLVVQMNGKRNEGQILKPPVAG
jgi:hypothetical protein